MFAVPDDRAVPVKHFIAQPEVEVVSRVVQAGQREQPNEQRDGIGLAVVMGRRPGRTAPAARHGRPVRFGDVQVAVGTARVRVRSEPADGETVQRHLQRTKHDNNQYILFSQKSNRLQKHYLVYKTKKKIQFYWFLKQTLEVLSLNVNMIIQT